METSVMDMFRVINVMVLWHFAAYCGTDQICPAFKYRGCQSNEREDQAGNI